MSWIAAAVADTAAVGLAYVAIRRCRGIRPTPSRPFARRVGMVLAAGLVAGALLAADGPPVEVVEVPSPMPSAWKEIRGSAGVPVRVKVSTDKAARWVLVDELDSVNQPVATLDVAADGKSASFVARRKGTYKAVVWAEAGEPGRIKYVIDGGDPDPVPVPVPPGPGPNPGPGPDPTPPDPDDGKPKPHPKPGAVKAFVIVEDTAKPGTFRGDILGSVKVQSTYKTLGLTHRLIDVNADPASLDSIGQKHLATAKASGIAPPILVTLDGPLGTGKLIATAACPKDVDGFCGALGGAVGPRKMGLIFPEGGKLKAAWKEFGDAANVPLIARADWRPVDYSNFLPPVHDQDGRGQCASSSACTVLETARSIAGMPYVYFSAGDLYGRVNGGRDDGSMLEDNMAELVKDGACEASLVPYIWDGKQDADRRNIAAVKAARSKHKVIEVYVCPSFDALGSAIQQGFVGQVGLMWYPNYTPDRDGWLPRGNGKPGGHALVAYGMAKNPKTGEWGLLIRNSWSEGWGVHGNCIIPESAFGKDIGGFWCVRAVTETSRALPPRTPFDAFTEYALTP